MLEKWNEIPKELVLGWPRSVLLGDEKLIVEQHQGIYACTQEEIVLRTQCGLMSITVCSSVDSEVAADPII